MTCSVIIPTYNRREPLEKTLASVFSQERGVEEVIVIDDGSTDGTPEYLASLGNRIRWEVQRNLGPGAARNRGIELARSEWVAFLDSDDLWFPWTWSRYAEAIEASGAGLVFGKPQRFKREDELESVCRRDGEAEWLGFDDYFRSGDEWRWWGASSFVVRRDFLDQVRFINQSINAEDADFVMKLGDGIRLAQLVGAPSFGYREHEGSVMLNFEKTVAGARNLVDSELAGKYPGGVGREAERRVILSRHLRPVILELLRNGRKQEGWHLFKDTLPWHLSQGRWRFLIAASGLRFLK